MERVLLSSYTVVDLVEAIAAGDANRVEVVASALGLRVPPRATDSDEPALPVAAKEGLDDFYLSGLLSACLRSRPSGISPFREYLESPEVIITLFQRFAAGSASWRRPASGWCSAHCSAR